jgi:hypothetical protein
MRMEVPVLQSLYAGKPVVVNLKTAKALGLTIPLSSVPLDPKRFVYA